MMRLFSKDGTPKLVPTCEYPRTAVGCVSRVYADHAVFEIGHGEGVRVTHTFGLSVDELSESLDVPLVRWPSSVRPVAGWRHDVTH